MKKTPRISLEQWRALLAVVDQGGYAQAAEALHKTQSSVSYAIHKMEDLLGVKVLEVHGRKAELTRTGKMLLRRARQLVDEAGELEAAAERLQDGWEAEVGIAVDHLFPVDKLLQALDQFSAQAPSTRIELHETVLSGNEEALYEGRVDLAITPIVPIGFLGDALLPVEFQAVAHPDHPLHQLERELNYHDLRQHRQLVTRDSGRLRNQDAGWLDAEQRWTVSHMSSAIRAVCMGLGFAWFPIHAIAGHIKAGRLKALPLREGAQRSVMLHLVYADRDYAGPATETLARLIRESATTVRDDINRLP